MERAWLLFSVPMLAQWSVIEGIASSRHNLISSSSSWRNRRDSIFGTFLNSILLFKSSFIVIFLYPTYPGSFSASNSSAMLAKSFSVTATEKPTASTKQNEAKKTDIFILTSLLELEFSTVGSLKGHCFYASHSGDIKIHFSLRHPIFDHRM